MNSHIYGVAHWPESDWSNINLATPTWNGVHKLMNSHIYRVTHWSNQSPYGEAWLASATHVERAY